MNIHTDHTLFASGFARAKKYERHVSAVAMIAGFAFDNYYFGRVDHPATQIVLLSYVVCAIATVLLTYFIETRAQQGSVFQKLHPVVVAASQFALGGLWSAFLIFYGRSAVVSTSWPFLFILAAMLVGNELFKRYHSRLVFTCTLLFFALLSYAIFAVPLVTRSMGRVTFVMSSILALGVFSVVIAILWAIGRDRIRQAAREIVVAALGVLAIVNLFYFTNILPPLPLALANAGVFHSITRVGADYEATAETNPWYRPIGLTPVVHLGSGEPIYFYSAVFAPIQLRTEIVHIWQRYDRSRSHWETISTVRFPITGGRDGGYRGYSIKSNPTPGLWRVDVETADGLLIGRVPFSVRSGPITENNVQMLK